MDVDLTSEPIGKGKDGKDVFLKDIWPTRHEVEQTIEKAIQGKMYADVYATAFDGDEAWRALDVPEGDLYAWD
ncbi:hypothetical protein ACSLVN_28110, partial [Klebsiella pneumoniae]|uniref:hypothetical protein n=1 Tax=Klebsiella pneumoniae TaxID=573 RepID=UPI003EE1D938